MSILRSLFFVPGNNNRFVSKARSLKSDIICFDLEDSVPQNQKQIARQLIHDELQKTEKYNPQIYVRINSPKSDYLDEDLLVITKCDINGIVIPKVNNAKEIKIIENKLSKLETDDEFNHIKFIPSIESAQGVINSYDIASCSSHVYALIFGIFDLLNDLGIRYTKKLAATNFARTKIPIDAKAAGIFAIDSIWQDLEDADGLFNDCIVGRDLGYSGKSIIHPNQLQTTHDVFKPNNDEIKWAKMVYDSYSQAIKNGIGSIKLKNNIIDEVHYKMAKSLLEDAGKL